MTNNLIIHGLDGDLEQEDIKQIVLKFMADKMDMEVAEMEVIRAFRLGQKMGKKPGRVLVHCSGSLRNRVFKCTKNLQGKRNNLNGFYYVNQQLPEQYEAERKELQAKVKNIKNSNQHLPPEKRSKQSSKRMFYM